MKTVCLIRPQYYVKQETEDTDWTHHDIPDGVQSKLELKAQQVTQRRPELNFLCRQNRLRCQNRLCCRSLLCCQSAALMVEARVCLKVGKMDNPAQQASDSVL